MINSVRKSALAVVPLALLLHGALTASSPDPVTVSSSRTPAQGAAALFDRNKATVWVSADDDNRPTVQIDRGSARSIGRIVLTLGAEVDPNSRAQFEIVGSNRADIDDGVVICAQGDPLPAGATLTCDFRVDTRFRYITVRKVRERQPLAIADLSMLDQIPVAALQDIAWRKPVDASSIADLDHNADRINDGKQDTGWRPAASDRAPTLTIDLMRPYPLDRVRVQGRLTAGIRIEAATDPAFRQPVRLRAVSVTDDLGEFAGSGAATRYVRVVTPRGDVSLSDIQVMSRQPDARWQRTEWFHKAKYGVFLHFLKDRANMTGDWNETVRAFDVNRFARDMADAGVGYVIITLGQNSGYFIAPSPTYDRLTGYRPGERNALRDLPLDLHAALARHDIKLMLYSSTGAPLRDPKASKALGWTDNKSASQQFQAKWEQVIADWSRRYGDKVAGWWFDGMYCRECYADFSKPHNYNSFVRAAQSGNPDAIVGLNVGGIVDEPEVATNAEDFTSGELSFVTRSKPLSRHVFTPPRPFIEQSRYHVLTYLGSYWGDEDVKYGNEYLSQYVKQLNDSGGVVSFDVAIYRDGSIPAGQLEQLKSLKRSLKP